MNKLQSSFTNPDDSPGLLLWRVTNSWQRTIRATLAPFDLTHVQFVLLAVLSSREDTAGLTQRELAEIAATDPMMTSQVLRTLEAKGLIERKNHPQDGRARIVSPTPDGLALVNDAITAVEAADSKYFAALKGDQQRFVRNLHTLLSAPTAKNAQTPENGRRS